MNKAQFVTDEDEVMELEIVNELAPPDSFRPKMKFLMPDGVTIVEMETTDQIAYGDSDDDDPDDEEYYLADHNK